MNNKKLKGFTLIELIVVMAVFGLLIMGALQLVEPANKIMKSTSTMESHAGSVDNVKRYLESSLRYAQYVNVFPGDYNDAASKYFSDPNSYHYRNGIADNGIVFDADANLNRSKAVTQFVTDYFDGRETDPDKYCQATVRVIELDNTTGRITDSAYICKAGNKSLGISPIIGSPSTRDVVNADYFSKGYTFNYALGYYEIQNGNYVMPRNASADPLNPLSQEMFDLSIVTYPVGGKTTGLVPFTLGDGSVVNVNGYTFKEPFFITTSAMALVNVNSAENTKVNYFKIKRDAANNPIPGEAHDPVTQTKIAGLGWEREETILFGEDIIGEIKRSFIVSNLGTNRWDDPVDKICIIYVLPSEIILPGEAGYIF